MAPTYKNYVFTINNPTTPVVFDSESMHCLIYQLERGESGTDHYQGYVEFLRRITPSTAKGLIGQNAHLESRRGTRAQAIIYATKADTRIEGPFEFGNLEPTQGKRRDIHEFKDWYMREKRTIDDCIDYNPEIVAKYPRLISTLAGCFRRRNLARNDQQFVPNPGWQTELAEYLGTTPDPRKIVWFYDEAGNTGKSYFASNYAPSRSYIITGGRFGDIQYGYLNAGTPSIVIFDWARDQEDRFPYCLVETFKNGYFLNTKYESEPVRFSTPHVVIFSNSYPDRSKLSEDRWIIKVIE